MLIMLVFVLVLLLVKNINSFNTISNRNGHSNKFHLTMISRFDRNEVIGQVLSKEVLSVYQQFKRSPSSFTPTKEQAILLLNNINQLVITNTLTDISKFYDKLHNLGIMKGYGSMNNDGPLNSLRLPDLEHMLYSDPTSIFEYTGINSEHVENLEIPNYNTRGYTASSYSNKDNDYKTAYHSFIVASLQSILSISIKDTFFDPTMLLLSILLLTSAIVVDGPTMFDGLFSRQMSWMSFRISTLLNATERKKETRRNAGTFLIAYLVGTPIKRFENVNDLNPNSIFVSPDGPKIDLQDPALQNGIMDIHGLNRISATFMASSAVDSFDGRKVQPLNNYMKQFLALIGLRSSKPLFSNVSSKEFPQKLLPTLSIWGFLQSSLILKEVGSKVLDAVTEVFEKGGGVGDAIFAIEANLPAEYMNASPTATRRQIRKMTEDSFSKSKRSVVSTLSTILEAKSVQIINEDAITDAEIALIPGTDRKYTKDELILRPMATIAEVDDCAKTLMHLMQLVDKKKYGKVQRETQMKMRDIASQLVNAKLALEINKVENEIIEEQVSISEANKQLSGISFDTVTVYESLGLSNSFASFLAKNSNSFLVDTLLDPLLDISNTKKFFMGNLNKIEEWWLFYGSIIFDQALGITSKNFINNIWDADNITTDIMEEGQGDSASKSTKTEMIEKTKELKNILKASYDSEADALLMHIKKLTERKEPFNKMVEDQSGTFSNILQNEKDKNMIRIKQINDRIAELKRIKN